MLNRRQFIKSAAAAATMIACSPEIFAGEGEKVITHATHMGPLKMHVRDGKIIKIEAMDADKEPVDIMFAMKDLIYAKNRIKYPCVRKSYLEGKDARHLRGAEEFVRVSWEQALELTAQALMNTKENYGNESIFKTTYASWSHTGRVHQAASLQARMLGFFGGFTDIVGDYSAGAAIQVLPYIFGDLEVYSPQTSKEVVLENTELMLMWGADPFKTDKVDYNVPIHSGNEWFRNMRKKGVKFISIDPIRNHTAKEIGSEWVPIKASRDVPMILAMCHTLYVEKLYSKEFIDKYTVGFGVIERYLTGEKDGVVKDAVWAEKICGVPAEKIKELARMAVKHRTLLLASWACQRCQHGEQLHWSLVTLGCMIGQIGLPGGGLYLNTAYGNPGATYSGAGVPLMVPQGRNSVRSMIPASRMADLLLNPGKTINYSGSRITYPNIRLIYSAGVTPIGHHPDLNKLIKGFRNVDSVITHDPWWTPTAKYSDIVLPVTTSFERNDIAFGSSYGAEYIFAMKKVISPLFEAKDDYEIFRELSAMFGFEKEFTRGNSIQDWIKYSYHKVHTDVPFEEFWEKGYIHLIPPENTKQFVRHSDFRNDPVNNHLITPSGKIELFCEKIASFGYKDCPGYPAWLEPAEGPETELGKEYPFQLITPHPLHRLHSQLDNTPLADTYKVNGKEPMYINTADAKKLGISDGEIVEIYNNRGSILAGTKFTKNIIEGVIAVEEGAWYSPENPLQQNPRCTSGQVNVLTSDRPTSSLAQAFSANTCQVSIRKINEKVPPTKAYDNPIIIGGEK